jgi:hypothetical protein
MLKQVSWADYLSGIAVVLAVYYFIILLLFYRDEIRQLLTGKGKVFSRGEVATPESDK